MAGTWERISQAGETGAGRERKEINMSQSHYRYVVVGAGAAGASALAGIREIDQEGAILLVGKEKHLPYERPPLSKRMWGGKKKVESLFLHPKEWYAENGVEVRLGTEVVGLEATAREVTVESGEVYTFERLLLATGGIPRRLPVPGGDSEGLCYYRYLDDFLRLREKLSESKAATVIGGGFIGSEMAAALHNRGVEVTMIYPERYLVARVFPEGLGRALQEYYQEQGVRILSGTKPVSIVRSGERWEVNLDSGAQVESEILLAGVGIAPETALAEQAGLRVGNGVVVNEYQQTSHPDIYAAGDNAWFPYRALETETRIEHWDHAVNHGKQAGRNLAGAEEPYDYMPYFYSDLFKFGYEAVGEVDSRLEIFADWQEKYHTGVIYYLQEGRVRGAMMCNLWEKVDAARELIKSGERVGEGDLRGAIQ